MLKLHNRAFVLGALAALWKPVFSQPEKTYTIGSASLDASLVLDENNTDWGLVEFVPKNGNSGQTWFFHPTDFSYTEFSIQNDLGYYIICGEDARFPCGTGATPQIYTAEATGDAKFHLVTKGSGYFLRVNENRKVELSELAEGDQTPNEEFTVTPLT